MTSFLAVIYLTVNKLRVSTIQNGQKETFEIDWDGKDLSPSFKQIKQQLGVESVKVISASPDFEKLLKSAATQNQLKLELSNTPDEIIAQITQNEPEPLLAFWSGPEDVLCLIKNGQIIEKHVAPQIKDKDVKSLIAIAKKKGFPVKTLIYNSSINHLPDLPKSIKTKPMDLNPLYYLLEKYDPDDKPVFLPRNKNSNKKTIFIISTVSLFIISLLAGGLWISQTAVDKKEELPSVATPTPSPSPTPTPIEKIDLTEYSIQIQNGSGVPGEAKKAQKLLKAEGFENIKAGNADSYDYTQTIISLKKSVPQQVYQVLDKTLNRQYNLDKQSLSSDSDYDIIIILGETK